MFARARLRRERIATLHLARDAMHQADPDPAWLLAGRQFAGRQFIRDRAEKLVPLPAVNRLAQREQGYGDTLLNPL